MSKWIKASEKLPKGKVLVIFLEPFFGGLYPETTVGYYDNPEDYEDGDGDGWKDWYTNNSIKVTHWMRLPTIPTYLVDINITQEELLKNKLGTVKL